MITNDHESCSSVLSIFSSTHFQRSQNFNMSSIKNVLRTPSYFMLCSLPVKLTRCYLYLSLNTNARREHVQTLLRVEHADWMHGLQPQPKLQMTSPTLTGYSQFSCYCKTLTYSILSPHIRDSLLEKVVHATHWLKSSRKSMYQIIKELAKLYIMDR